MISKASLLFHHDFLIIIKVTFDFPEFISAYKKQLISSIGLCDAAGFRVPRPKRPTFDHHHQKIVKVTFSFHEFVSTHQTSIYFIHLSLTYSQFYGPENRVVTPIFDHTHPNIFQSTSTFHESYQHAKNQAFSLFYSRDIVHLKIL